MRNAVTSILIKKNGPRNADFYIQLKMSVITNKPFPKYLKLVKLIEMVKFKLGNEM